MNVPFYFPTQSERLFGWLYEPVSPVSQVGLVICKPFGYEALCAHRSIRAFGLAAAARGVPALTFDYTGTGDSVDVDERRDQLELWCQDIVDAVVALRRRTGVQRVCLLGFRLGALLASLVCARTSVDGLIVIAPIVNGASYLRELRTIQMMSSRRVEQSTRRAQEGGSGPHAMEVSGYVMSAKTVESLRTVDLAAQGPLPISSMLVVDRAGQPTAERWSKALADAGLKTEYVVLAGFVDMMMTVPQYARVPHAMIDHVRGWLSDFASEAGSAKEDLIEPISVVPLSRTLAIAGESVDLGLIERPVHFGPNSLLFGILTELPRRAALKGAVVLANAGAAHHVCVGRMYVRLARRWARQGYVVLRMDLAGLGDSDTRCGRPENEVYPPAAVEDLRTATTMLQNEYGLSAIAVGGVCSGGFHALRAAAAGVPVSKIFIVNPDLFFSRNNIGFNDIQVIEEEVVSARGGWRGFKHEVAKASRVAAERWIELTMFRVMPALRGLARLVRLHLPNDVGWEFQRLAARGIDVTLVFARGEPGIRLLKLQGGDRLERAGGRFRMYFVDNADHTFSHSVARAQLEEILSDALFSDRESSGGGE